MFEVYFKKTLYAFAFPSEKSKIWNITSYGINIAKSISDFRYLDITNVQSSQI